MNYPGIVIRLSCLSKFFIVNGRSRFWGFHCISVGNIATKSLCGLTIILPMHDHGLLRNGSNHENLNP